MAQPQRQINISSLSPEQLQKLVQSVEGELEFLIGSFQQLKAAQGQFADSRNCVTKLSADSLGQAVLVPMTSSLYVPGELADVDNVLVDVGTGYYVKKSTEEACQFFDRKIEAIKTNIESLQSSIQEKKQLVDVAKDVLRDKIAALEQQQQQH